MELSLLRRQIKEPKPQLHCPFDAWSRLLRETAEYKNPRDINVLSVNTFCFPERLLEKLMFNEQTNKHVDS